MLFKNLFDKDKSNGQSNNTFSEESLKKAKLLITIVDRNKVEFYLDVLAVLESNLQVVTFGRGTASSEVRDMLGLSNFKGIIFSIIREDMVSTVKRRLEERFKTIKNGKGISVVIPLASVMGVRLYQFMMNNNERKGN